jgi:hypothetical protein
MYLFFDLHFSLVWHKATHLLCVGHLITKTLLKLPNGTFPFQKLEMPSMCSEHHLLNIVLVHANLMISTA